jgi:hypothetical protein
MRISTVCRNRSWRISVLGAMCVKSAELGIAGYRLIVQRLLHQLPGITPKRRALDLSPILRSAATRKGEPEHCQPRNHRSTRVASPGNLTAAATAVAQTSWWATLPVHNYDRSLGHAGG